MQLQLTITMDNAAFADDGNDGKSEAARIIRDFAKHLESGSDFQTLKDINGNTVGMAAIAD